MATENLDKYKIRLRDYINKKGIEIQSSGGADRIQCPFHEDQKPSLIIYETSLHCPVCSTTASVFDFAGKLIGSNNFPDMLNEVKKTLGETIEDFKPVAKKKKSTPSKYIALDAKKAKDIFKKSTLLSQSSFVGGGDAKNGYGDEIIGAWPYKNENGLIELVDVRFEGNEKKKKNIISFYYDGKNIKAKNPPVLIYNRNLIKKYPDAIILIVEGCKTAKAAECLIEFGIIPVTWNGGSSKVLKPDWSCVYHRDVFFFPDDDEPGIRAAKLFMKEYGDLINENKIIHPYKEARKIKSKGADIVEVLQLLSPDDLVKYILKNSLEENPEPGNATPAKSEPIDNNTSRVSELGELPFSILGTADDGKAYFLDRHNRLMDTKVESLTLNKLLKLADLNYWLQYIGSNKVGKDDLILIINDIIEIANDKDFNIDNLRGRGAWKEPGNKICYHDGKKTIGEYSKEKVFLRKDKIDIGIGSKPISQDLVNKMKEVCFDLSFETRSDAMRLLSWSIIAPFAGALDWRPQAFLTGPSSSGKSSIENYIVKPLAIPFRVNGGETSGAGYMQNRKNDSGAVVIEESDADTEKKKKYKEDLLSIMRQSTSDDTPKGYKGTSDQTGKSYTTRDMFLFIAIIPDIESVADDNRLVKINITRPTNKKKWGALKADLLKYYSKSNCNSLRGMVWNSLKEIILLSDIISSLIQDHTGKGHRFAISEGILMATYFIIWKGIKNPTNEELEIFIKNNYDIKKPEDDRDDAEEIIDRLLQFKVKVHLAKMKEYNVLEVLKIVKTGKRENGNEDDINGQELLTKEDLTEFKRSVNNIGVTVDNNGNLAIANSHNEIKRITGRSNGYSRILRRHKNCIDPSKNIVFIDKCRRCSVLSDILDDIIEEIEEEEIPF